MKIIISPWSRALRNGQENPKNFPLKSWSEVTTTLSKEGYDITQTGVGNEVVLPEVTTAFFNHTLKELKEEMDKNDLFISVDNFFQHFAHLHNKKGIVIFSQSNPKIFGHPENVNLLKDEKYLRPLQFDIWESCKYNPDAYVEPSVVIDAVHNWSSYV